MIDHVYKRINERLADFVTPQMVHTAEFIAKIVGTGKYYVELKRFDTCLHIDCPENVNGDILVAVIKDNVLVTIMLAKSWKRDYYKDGKYVTYAAV